MIPKTIEIRSFSGPSVVDMDGSDGPTVVVLNQGPTGPAGPNEITTATETNLTGFIYGDGTNVGGAVEAVYAGVDYEAYYGKLVRYDVSNASIWAPATINFGFGPEGGDNYSTLNGGPTGQYYNLPNASGTISITKNANGANDDTEIYVKAAQPITAGQAVYISDALGAVKIISLAQANTDALSSKTLGLAAQSLANNQFGYVVTEGDLSGLSINLGSEHTVTEGDPIWLSPTTPGGLLFGTANKPSAPNHLVFLGIVTRINGNTLTDIYVKVQNGFELEELHNVAINDEQNGQVLTYESSTQLWKNKANYTAKSTTGNPATGIEGEICINTFDNNVKIYADGGWRQIATW